MHKSYQTEFEIPFDIQEAKKRGIICRENDIDIDILTLKSDKEIMYICV